MTLEVEVELEATKFDGRDAEDDTTPTTIPPSRRPEPTTENNTPRQPLHSRTVTGEGKAKTTR